MNRLIFEEPIYSLQTFVFQSINGLTLHKTLIANQNLRHINITLQTIDDLYILLDGLIPNIKTIIVRLWQTRLKCRRLPCKSLYSQLTDFTLLENNIGLVIDDIKCILAYMRNLIKLSLSIRNTPDPTFCHGTKFESILNEYLPNLRQFDYTMTHQMNDNTLIETFIQWPMSFVFYENENENCKWVHIYSLPWPSSKRDKRELPIFQDGYHTSNVNKSEYMNDIIITTSDEFYLLTTQFRCAYQITTNLSIDTILPSRIAKLILSKETPINSINSLIQPSVRHLIVERRLTDQSEIPKLTRQFPHVQYVELLLPLERSLFVACLRKLLSFDNKKETRCYWPQLINFSTCLVITQIDFIWLGENLPLWFSKNTDLKYFPFPFFADYSDSILYIWF